jgi:DNA polymerase family A
MNTPNGKSLQREALQKVSHNKKYSPLARELAQLRLNYSVDAKLLTGYINSLIGTTRIYPSHLPTQTSGRWSTLNPPLSNFPRVCINPECSQDDHEWTDDCWSIRDILLPDSDEILISFDMDNIEGRIHDLIVQDTSALEAHREGYDLHTLTCCDIFQYQYPQDRKNPHSSLVDTAWRHQYNWQGKDTKQRVLAKNFNHGSKYSKSHTFVHKITGIEKYGVTQKHLVTLAKQYIHSKGEVWQRKLAIMDKIQQDRVARTLYGFKRTFWDSSEETAREGFSHVISGTASDYNNETLQLFDSALGDAVRLLHNAHDGNKLAIKRNCLPSLSALKQLIEREVTHKNTSLILTASLKIHI